MISSCKKVIRRVLDHIEERQNRINLEALRGLLDGRTLTLVDVGAAGDIEPRWKRIAPLLRYVGFEPDARSATEIENRKTSCASYKIFPCAVWENAGEISFHLCRKPMVSSHFPPNAPFLSRFPDFSRFDIAAQPTLTTSRIDDLAIGGADFMKLDIQGGELSALKGGLDLLRNCLGLEIEVEFLPIYEGQPLFGDVAAFLAREGFEFIDFIHFARWERNALSGYGQCIFGDALFLRSPEHLMETHGPSVDIALKYVAVCALYEKFDLIDRLSALFAGNAEVQRHLDRATSRLSFLRRRHLRARRITTFATRVLRLLGRQYQPHLLH